MKRFMHAREHMDPGDVAVVNCSHQCNVLILDDDNYASFAKGGRYFYYGGYYKMLPAKLAVPTAGEWNIVLHLGGSDDAFQYSIAVTKAAQHNPRVTPQPRQTASGT